MRAIAPITGLGETWEMRRLRDGQAVSLEVEALETNLECLVIAIEGNEATLDPIYKSFSMSVSTVGTNALLTFEHQGRLVMLRGRARREDDGLHFAVTDKVTVEQRRRYARVEAALPVMLTPLNGSGEPAGKPVATRSFDVSADGVLLEAQISPTLQRLRLSLLLPDGAPPVECDVRLIRQVGWRSALRYSGISDCDRERLKCFVAERKRDALMAQREK
jgi:c-di-GMP-binding flagellar brake protein YcgR